MLVARSYGNARRFQTAAASVLADLAPVHSPIDAEHPLARRARTV